MVFCGKIYIGDIMKKLLSKVLILILALSFALSLSGCIIDFSGDLTKPDDNKVTGTVAELPDSITKSSDVSFDSYTATEREQSPITMQEAINNVKRSSVYISVAVSGGTSLGSGTIIDINDGVNNPNTFYVLTCYHVVASKGNITIIVPDLNYRYGENEDYTFTGKIGGTVTAGQQVSLVGGDMESDVAVLKLYIANTSVAQSIVKAKIMDSAFKVSEGDEVFAIGNPTGVLPGTVTSGIISYVFRKEQIENIGEMTLYQIDVNIRHGSSGGGLYNDYGELIGITNSGSDEDYIFYAIPLRITDDPKTDNGFSNIVKQLVSTKTDSNYGYISERREKFGFTVTETKDNNNESYLYVSQVISGSYADKAGIKANSYTTDVITHFEYDGVKSEINTIDAFTTKMKSVPIGGTFKIYITRQETNYRGKVTTSEVTVSLTVSMAYFCDTGVYPE